VNPRTQHPCYSPLTLPQTKNNHLKDEEKSPRHTTKKASPRQTRKRASHSSCKPSKHNTLHIQANCNLESDQNANQSQNNSHNSIKQLPITFARSLENYFWSCKFLVSDAHTKLLRQKKKKKKKKQRLKFSCVEPRSSHNGYVIWCAQLAALASATSFPNILLVIEWLIMVQLNHWI
jgi:hypothetical protein